MAYVAGNITLYYEKADPVRFISPDLLVTLGIPKLPERKDYQTWKEGKGPDFVIDINSKTTPRDEIHQKLLVYQDMLRVQEIFIFDPSGDFLDCPLMGFTLGNGDYEKIPFMKKRLPSKVTGLHLEQEGEYLRFFDPKTEEYIPTYEDLLKEIKSARTSLHEADNAKRSAEGVTERLRCEIQALRHQQLRLDQLPE